MSPTNQAVEIPIGEVEKTKDFGTPSPKGTTKRAKSREDKKAVTAWIDLELYLEIAYATVDYDCSIQDLIIQGLKDQLRYLATQPKVRSRSH